jgi:hypothetical protein
MRPICLFMRQHFHCFYQWKCHDFSQVKYSVMRCGPGMVVISETVV